MDKRKSKKRAVAILVRVCSCAIGFILLFSSLVLFTLSFILRRKGVLLCSVLLISTGLLLDIIFSSLDIKWTNTAQVKIPEFFLPRGDKGFSHPKPYESSHPERIIQCKGLYNLTLSQWLSHAYTSSAKLCEPTFYPPTLHANLTKPVKVFILIGQSNRHGTELTSGKNNYKKTYRRSLEYAVKEKKRFTHLFNTSSGEWSTYRNARSVVVNSHGVSRNEWLGENTDPTSPRKEWGNGLDLQFGYIMSQVLGDSPILILKSSIGNLDLLPPATPEYKLDAGSGGTPQRWKVGTTNPNPSKWNAGKRYEINTGNVKDILENLSDYYPGVTHGNYEIEGFVWWLGRQDLDLTGTVHRYEQNLANLIRSLRHDFHAPRAKFALATIGFGGFNMTKEAQQVTKAHLAVSGDADKYPDFRGNVHTVNIRSSWHEPEGLKDPDHYHRHAETYLETGNALGWSMANLVLRSH